MYTNTKCHSNCLVQCARHNVVTKRAANLYIFTTHSGFTALHLAIVKSRNEVAKMLMSELGAKGVGAVGESGITAAHVAASAGTDIHVLQSLVNII